MSPPPQIISSCRDTPGQPLKPRSWPVAPSPSTTALLLIVSTLPKPPAGARVIGLHISGVCVGSRCFQTGRAIESVRTCECEIGGGAAVSFNNLDRLIRRDRPAERNKGTSRVSDCHKTQSVYVKATQRQRKD